MIIRKVVLSNKLNKPLQASGQRFSGKPCLDKLDHEPEAFTVKVHTATNKYFNVGVLNALKKKFNLERPGQKAVISYETLGLTTVSGLKLGEHGEMFLSFLVKDENTLNKDAFGSFVDVTFELSIDDGSIINVAEERFGHQIKNFSTRVDYKHFMDVLRRDFSTLLSLEYVGKNGLESWYQEAA